MILGKVYEYGQNWKKLLMFNPLPSHYQKTEIYYRIHHYMKNLLQKQNYNK